MRLTAKKELVYFYRLKYFLAERIKNFMDKIFPLLMTRNSENEIYVEFSTSLVWTLLKKSQRLLANQFRKQIFEIFDSDEFFKCSRNSLRNWSKIIAWGISVSKQDV